MTTTPRKKRITTETTPPLYKVLRGSESCHGGSLTWPLPHDDAPGDWQAVAPPIRLCERGLHLTREPVRWMLPGATVYLAEGDGESTTNGGDKTAFERVRLLRELTADELADFQIYQEGNHQVRGAHAWASGSATVEAWDSATVRAWDSATVISTPYHSLSAEVALSRLAAHVDRRGSGLVLRQAEDNQRPNEEAPQ